MTSFTPCNDPEGEEAVFSAHCKPEATIQFFSKPAFCGLLLLTGLTLALKILFKHQELQTNKAGKADALVCEHSKCDTGHVPQTKEK